MPRLIIVPIATLLLLLGGLAAAPAVMAGNPCFHSFEMPERSVGSEPQIKMMPCAFGPTVTHVAVGSTVTFFNGPDFTHLITGANQEWGSPDVEVQPDQTVSYTFDKAGIYPYACALHPGMSGAIVVGSAAATTHTDAQPVSSTSSQAPAAAAPGQDAARAAAIGLAGALAGGLLVLGIVRNRAARKQA